MFCKNCGTEIIDNAVICPHCGVQVANIGAAANISNACKDTSNPIAIVGFVLSFFICLAGLICSIVGYRKAKNEGLDNQGLALAGIIISSIELASVVILIISFIAMCTCAIANMPSDPPYYPYY